MVPLIGCSRTGKLIYGNDNQNSGCISGVEWVAGRRLTWERHKGTSWSEEMFYLEKGVGHMAHRFVKTPLPVTLRVVHFTIYKLNIYF